MIAAQFEDALDQAGLSIKDHVIADGLLHRFHVEGDKAGSKNGWYILFSDSIPAGSFGSWRTGEKHTWCSQDFKTLSIREKRAFQKRMKDADIARKREQEIRYKAAREKAQTIWDESDPCLSHPYLTKKKVEPYGLRIHNKALVIPLHDSTGILTCPT